MFHASLTNASLTSSAPGVPEKEKRVRFVQVAILEFSEDVKELKVLEEYMSHGSHGHNMPQLMGKTPAGTSGKKAIKKRVSPRTPV